MKEFIISEEVLEAMQRISRREQALRKKLYGENYKNKIIDSKDILGYDPNLNLTPEQKKALEEKQYREFVEQITEEITTMREESEYLYPKILPSPIINEKMKFDINLNPSPIPKEKIYYTPTDMPKIPDYNIKDTTPIDTLTEGRK